MTVRNMTEPFFRRAVINPANVCSECTDVSHEVRRVFRMKPSARFLRVRKEVRITEKI